MSVLVGDARHLPLPDASVDAIVTDPPYGLGFMGAEWDSDVPGLEFWTEALRVAKPGSYLVAWGGPRTSHHLALGLERAGWEIRDKLLHLFGSGFPKSHDISKAIDAEAGPPPATEAAKRWHGWGTALKPVYEEGWLCQKPRDGTFAANVLKHGVGGLNIDGCRVPTTRQERDWMRATCHPGGTKGGNGGGSVLMQYDKPEPFDPNFAGRWPPHLLLTHDACCGERCVDGCPVRELDRQSGPRRAGGNLTGNEPRRDCFSGPVYSDGVSPRAWDSYGDNGGASRFFPRFRYLPKASRSERDAGLDGFALKPARERHMYDTLPDRRMNREQARNPSRNAHPTVKPLDLMRWLVRLVTPPGGLVLDPFMGSGTTGCAAALEGMRFVGIDREPEYVAIARARIAYWSGVAKLPADPHNRETYTTDDPAQGDLFGGAEPDRQESEAA